MPTRSFRRRPGRNLPCTASCSQFSSACWREETTRKAGRTCTRRARARTGRQSRVHDPRQRQIPAVVGGQRTRERRDVPAASRAKPLAWPSWHPSSHPPVKQASPDPGSVNRGRDGPRKTVRRLVPHAHRVVGAAILRVDLGRVGQQQAGHPVWRRGIRSRYPSVTIGWASGSRNSHRSLHPRALEVRVDLPQRRLVGGKQARPASRSSSASPGGDVVRHVEEATAAVARRVDEVRLLDQAEERQTSGSATLVQ